MFGHRYITRLMLSAAYGLVAFAFLVWLYSGDTFCADHHSGGMPLSVFRLAVAITFLDSFASWGGSKLQSFGKEQGLALIAPVLSTAVIGFVLFLAPEWIYKGYGVFRFEGTFVDVSCLFAEGYGMVFPIVVAVPFAVLTLVRELLLRKLNRNL